MLAAGIHSPIPTTILGAVQFFARLLYLIGYKSSLNGKKLGAMMINFDIGAIYFLAFQGWMYALF